MEERKQAAFLLLSLAKATRKLTLAKMWTQWKAKAQRVAMSRARSVFIAPRTASSTLEPLSASLSAGEETEQDEPMPSQIPLKHLSLLQPIRVIKKRTLSESSFPPTLTATRKPRFMLRIKWKVRSIHSDPEIDYALEFG
jgi:hypothetical protein